MIGYAWNPALHLWQRTDGEDLAYSDGEQVEARLLAVVRDAGDTGTFSDDLFRAIQDWPSEYHFSRQRHCLLRPLGIRAGERVLELGCGCGALTRYLGETGAEVTAVEGSVARAAIASARCRDLVNVRVVQDDLAAFSSGQPFDWVLLVGVLEYAPVYAVSEDPIREYLAHAARFLAPQGKLVVAIENKLGLKYFNGCREDHLGRPYYGVQGLYGAGEPLTLGRAELAGRLRAAGFEQQRFFYPFPDYKLPALVLSAHALCCEGFSASNLLLACRAPDYGERPTRACFDEALAWNEVLKNGLLADLSNSFLVVARQGHAATSAPDTATLAWAFSIAGRRTPFMTETRFTREGERILVTRERILPDSAAPEIRTDAGLIRLQPGTCAFVPGSSCLHAFLRACRRTPDVLPAAESLQPWFRFLWSGRRLVAGGKERTGSAIGDYTVPGTWADGSPSRVLDGSGGCVAVPPGWVVDRDVPAGWVLVRSLLKCFAAAPGLPGHGKQADVAPLLQALLSGAGETATVRGEDIATWVAWEASLQTGIHGDPPAFRSSAADRWV